MPLTAAQKVTLKADILADPTLNAEPNNDDGAFAIAAAYNLNAVPDYWVWRSNVPKNEFTQSLSIDGTTFTWTGNGFIGRTQGERDAWRELFNATNSVNPSLANVRQAFQDIFSGAQAEAVANRAHMATVGRRKARRGEKLFATGLGTTVAPSVMGYEGTISFQDVSSARNLP